MSQDFPERLARSVYGKTDKANAPENNNSDFQDGYGVGKDSTSLPSDYILHEWQRRGEPDVDGSELSAFREWKRGFWAGRMQKTWLRTT